MDENHAKVHHKIKHQQDAASLHENLTEATSPTIETAAPAPTTSIVIVQAQSNDDKRPESPTSSHNVNSKNVQMSGVSKTACEKSSSSKENVENVIKNENADDESVLFHKSSAVNVPKYSPKSSAHKLQAKSMSDPPTSPAQRSVRSRSSNEKSPRQKRSKSESRRRRERKLIAAGEMEVRQANETLMRYLKQCSEVNDASLSGELEIDKNLDDRYHRKIQSQRERNDRHRSSDASIGTTGGGGKTSRTKSMSTFTMRAASFARERIPSSGLSNILQELTADIIPNHDEIYNPFTPVVSPTEGPRTDKMFIQTPRGFRSASDNNFLKTLANVDSECGRPLITNDAASLSCFVQRIWILLANISHGLLAGLALAHILFIGTTTPKDLLSGSIKSYLSSTEIYTNTFYCLAILCLVSVWDRMDICRCTVLSANESISFRWIIVVMIYMAIIILCLSSESSFDERFYVLSNVNTNNTSTSTMDMQVYNQILNIWSPMSLARSIGAIIGWLIIGFKEPMEDQLYNQLLEMQKYKVSNN